MLETAQTMKLLDTLTSRYVCQIPSLEQIDIRWEYEINNYNNPGNWNILKEKIIQDVLSNKSITYYGILDGVIISEATAAIDKDSYFVKDSKYLINDNTAYLSAFRTNEECRNQGFFSILFNYMIEDLKQRGYTQFTIGVEKNDYLNKAIYLKYGFTKYIKTQRMEYPNGESKEIEYYLK